MTTYCCERCNRAVEASYFVATHSVIVFLRPYSEAFYFPYEMRNLHFCPYCGNGIRHHIFSQSHCDPFLAGAQKGYFVYNLAADNFPNRKSSLLFNLLSYGEYRSASKYYYPEISAFSFCPYCGRRLGVRDGKVSVEPNVDSR